VDASTASFYLEASNWNPHRAVQLHMHSDGSGKRSKADRPKFASVPVSIVGLPDGWAAHVSEAGTIVFEELATGREQAAVPPGFPTPQEDVLETIESAAFSSEQPQAAAPAMDRPPEHHSDHMAVDGRDSARASKSPLQPPPLPAAHSEALRHPSVVCDGCQGPVIGPRFQCLTRANFDFCDRCMWSEDSARLREGQRWLKMSFVNT